VGPTTKLDFKEFWGEGMLRYVTMVREPGSGTEKLVKETSV
jgi:hypothetical protein